jgi:hypothetical protein
MSKEDKLSTPPDDVAEIAGVMERNIRADQTSSTGRKRKDF